LNFQWIVNSHKDNPSKFVNEKRATADPFFNNIKIEAKHNAIFDMNAGALNGSPLKLTPIIFSHGSMVDQAAHSRHCLELASHGYIVFCPNHNDGSCNYTEKSNGDPIFHNRSMKNFDYKRRKLQVDLRVKEI